MPLVQHRVEDRVAILTLDDPPANAYTHEMMLELDAAVLRARFDRSVDAIVLTGAGDRFFCAGANIGMLQKADPEWKYAFCLHANETLLRLEHTPKVVIAALNGFDSWTPVRKNEPKLPGVDPAAAITRVAEVAVTPTPARLIAKFSLSMPIVVLEDLGPGVVGWKS